MRPLLGRMPEDDLYEWLKQGTLSDFEWLLKHLATILHMRGYTEEFIGEIFDDCLADGVMRGIVKSKQPPGHAS